MQQGASFGGYMTLANEIETYSCDLLWQLTTRWRQHRGQGAGQWSRLKKKCMAEYGGVTEIL